ncbi:MAG TPA: TIR domain-containing protein, partial [Candidatus Kapabacteria bacterium]|nr:TIR domain-containing protein [Candidatus Kapabacteria bacterium]
MPDIFISYSRKDAVQALELAERLRAEGMGVWIDQRGIEAATSWSGEIADAIRGAKAFVLLLSASSTESPNVKKELGVATEVGCSLVPVEIETMELNRDFLYHLAGLQRVAIADFEGIVRALTKLGIGSGEAGEPGHYRSGAVPAPPKDSRKSLMILPFEDLSPTADNQWFADGIASELISALSNVKSLRLADNQATKEFRSYHGQLTTYAHTMNIRYFVQGDVRKFGDQIKISSRLLDIETGDHLWQDSMKGTMNDIFDIQEKVAEKVVEGLKVHLASDEKKKLAERGTENAEAYELYLKADEYSSRRTREGFRLAVQQITLAIELDPNYANALAFKAARLAELYRQYDRDPNLLIEAAQLAKRALEIKPDLWYAYGALSDVYRQQGRLREAEDAAKEYVRRAPEASAILGTFYTMTNQPALAIAPFEKRLELKPDDITCYFNLVITSNEAHDMARVEKWSRAALPLYERRLRLVPDDELTRVHYANLLRYAGYTEQAVVALAPLLGKKDLDGSSLYNIACLYASINDKAHALEALRR